MYKQIECANNIKEKEKIMEKIVKAKERKSESGIKEINECELVGEKWRGCAISSSLISAGCNFSRVGERGFYS
jgi:indole-3-glycerol phosphate synthase